MIDKFNRRMIGLQIFRFAELCNRARLQKVDSTFNLTFKLRKTREGYKIYIQILPSCIHTHVNGPV